ncbi:MAG: carbonic anhydrase [Epsilonproteobacteria bacterium]|nr:carbonic anhydrase [Campylobacterota bacterium]
MEVKELIKNYKKFKDIHFKEYQELFKKLAQEGQNPKTFFIGCSDSRVVPNLITGAKPGDLFIFRNIGNFVPPFKPDDDYHATAAAIEYAVNVLKVNNIIVCGHSQCGACESLYKEIPDTVDFAHIKRWLKIGYPAKELALKQIGTKDKEKLLRATEKLSVLIQLENLLTYPSVKRGVEQGKLFLHGWYYDIASGEVKYYDGESREFKILEA